MVLPAAIVNAKYEEVDDDEDDGGGVMRLISISRISPLVFVIVVVVVVVDVVVACFIRSAVVDITCNGSILALAFVVVVV